MFAFVLLRGEGAARVGRADSFWIFLFEMFCAFWKAKGAHIVLVSITWGRKEVSEAVELRGWRCLPTPLFWELSLVLKSQVPVLKRAAAGPRGY